MDAHRRGPGAGAAREDEREAFDGGQLRLTHDRKPRFLHHPRPFHVRWAVEDQNAGVHQPGAPGWHRNGQERLLGPASLRVGGDEERIRAAHRVPPVRERRAQQLVDRGVREAELRAHRREQRIDGERRAERLDLGRHPEPMWLHAAALQRAQDGPGGALDRK